MNSKRGQAVLISLRNDPDRQVGGKTVQWTVLSVEGHGSGMNEACLCLGYPFTACSFGVLAQLGERLICIQEVRSSILLGSTKS
jgi:hypothetical protein